MCGIVGLVGRENSQNILLKALKTLEYRGYDSAGIAMGDGDRLQCVKAVGKIEALEKKLTETPLVGSYGIAHTRWATHGRVTFENAHPHQSGPLFLVHNGIIENHVALRSFLEKKGYVFQGKSDTEVLVTLMAFYAQDHGDFFQAFCRTMEDLEGSYSLAVIHQAFPDTLFCARHGSPLVLGRGQGQDAYVASDALALSGLAQEVGYLHDGDKAKVSVEGITVYDANHQKKAFAFSPLKQAFQEMEKDGYPHYMLKEIYQQPMVITSLIQHHIQDQTLRWPFEVDWETLSNITMVACGSAYHACHVARDWFETQARIPVHLEIASEFRYRMPPLVKGSMALFVSQSGETADTLAALRYAKSQGQRCIAIVNVAESTLAREAHEVILLRVGPEIGVASTKAFMAMLMVLGLLALEATYARKQIDHPTFQKHLKNFVQLPGPLINTLSMRHALQQWTPHLKNHPHVLYIGRRVGWSLALEGALKFKELTYLHAEAFAAGELKHGAIALVDQKTPVIALITEGQVATKTRSNMEEAHARGATLFALSHQKETMEGTETLVLPKGTVWTDPFIFTIPLQFLAYDVANALGHDVDKPRNLAKSVTVE